MCAVGGVEGILWIPLHVVMVVVVVVVALFFHPPHLRLRLRRLPTRLSPSLHLLLLFEGCFLGDLVLE